MDSKFADHLFQFVKATMEANTKEAMIQVLVLYLSDLGYDRINICILHDLALPTQECQPSVHSTYPTVWMQHYQDQAYHRLDPVLKRAFAGHDPFAWQRLELDGKLPKSQIEFLREADDAGLHHGIGIPFPGGPSQVAGLALASSSKSLPAITDPFQLAIYANQFYVAYKRVLRGQNIGNIVAGDLTPKELAVMECLLSGATDKQIARRLKMALSTVNFHFRGIYDCLNVTNRVHAVVKVLTNRLIGF